MWGILSLHTYCKTKNIFHTFLHAFPTTDRGKNMFFFHNKNGLLSGLFYFCNLFSQIIRLCYKYFYFNLCYVTNIFPLFCLSNKLCWWESLSKSIIVLTNLIVSLFYFTCTIYHSNTLLCKLSLCVSQFVWINKFDIL